MFAYEFMRNAYAAAGIVAVVAAMVGYFLVLRGQTFAGHALSHVGFSGATGAALIGLAPLQGMLAAALAGGVCIGLLGEKLAQRDVAIGIALSFSLGLGLLFLHFYTSHATQATALLFGNVLAVSAHTVRVLLVFSLMVGPPAAAQRLTHRVGTGLALSVALALGSAWLGIALAYWTDWPCSFWITTLSCIAYLAAMMRRRSAP